MLRKLKAKIKELGLPRVTADLGYKSTMTIYTWLKKKKIPDLAKSRVEEYLR
jgi:hypothetical protein